MFVLVLVLVLDSVHGPNARIRNVEAFHEPSNEHAAPTELGEGPRGVGSYRHGAPTELFKPSSWSQCMRESETNLSMNRVGTMKHRPPLRSPLLRWRRGRRPQFMVTMPIA